MGSKSKYTDISIQNLFWILPILQTLSPISTFRNFMQSKKLDEDLALNGCKMLVQQITSKYMMDLETDGYLSLVQDDVTRRAFWMEVEDNKFDSACEKANLVRNVRRSFLQLGQSKNFDQLQQNVDLVGRQFLSPLETIFQNSVQLSAEIASDKESVLRTIAIFQMMNKVNRTITDYVHPSLLFGRGFTGIESDYDRGRLTKLLKRQEFQFLGFKASLAFLLHFLLKNEQLSDAIASANNWKNLQPLLIRAEDVAVQRLQDLTGLNIAFGKFFQSKLKPDKTLFGEFITKSGIPRLTQDEQIAQTLLWYYFELINSTSMIFSGASAFQSLLIGEAYRLSENRERKKVRVIRFVHLGQPTTFSYGILMERRGGISDLSGWLIFSEVGGDYDGTGGFEYQTTEHTLAKYDKYVSVSEFNVDNESLRRFFASKTHTEIEELRLKINHLEELRSASLGRLLEFVTKLFYESLGYKTRIYFNNSGVLSKRKEIDVLATNDKEIILIECSTYIKANVEDFVKEVNEKTDSIRSHIDFKNYAHFRKVFVTSQSTIRRLRSSKQVLTYLNDAGIEVLEIEDIISRRLP
ncbi:MAG: hypothetical protein ACREAO_00135, partial [Nitrososphaera sp.]